jgi:hypothetical protein
MRAGPGTLVELANIPAGALDFLTTRVPCYPRCRINRHGIAVMQIGLFADQRIT